MKDSIDKKIDEKIDSQTKKIEEKFDVLDRKFSSACQLHRDPQLIRQMIFELRISEINKAFPEAKLPKPGFENLTNKFRKKNGDFDHKSFIEEYEKFKNRMREEKLNETTHDLNRLFRYSLQV